jgi:prevent-host-death family protein
MKVWPVQHAKARFSELLDTCLKEGPQLVTRRGQQAAVLVPVPQWRRLAQAAKPTPSTFCSATSVGPSCKSQHAERGAPARPASSRDRAH